MATANLILGDCLEKMKELPDNSIDCIITDPPYGLEFMGKDWDTFKQGKNIAGGNTGIDTPFGRKQALPAFYQRELSEWLTFQEFNRKWATEALRVLKPGGFMFAMGGTRTHHRLTCGIEDAGFLIRDELCWVYMQGFPKAQDLGMMIEKKLGGEGQTTTTTKAAPTFHTQNVGGCIERTDTWDSKQPTIPQAKEWQGWKTPALKPAFEPIIVAQKPCEGSITENVMKHGVGGYNIDECRIPYADANDKSSSSSAFNSFSNNQGARDAALFPIGAEFERDISEKGRYPPNVLTAEPCFEGKEGIAKENDEPAAGHRPSAKSHKLAQFYEGGWKPVNQEDSYLQDSGGFSKFFLIPKASKGEKEENLEEWEEKKKWLRGGGVGIKERENITAKNYHPTVKPIALMQHLIKLTTKPKYTILDPFLGSGTTAVAALQLNRNVIGIEISEEYMKIAKARIAEEVKQTRLF